MRPPLACFFTDFGIQGPYLGLMEMALLQACPEARVVSLLSDAPVFSPRPSSYLLGALASWLPEGAVVVGVVDPGVGTARQPLVVEAGGRRFVGPDNGLFAALLRRKEARAWRILWRPQRLSSSFHGRDLFAPAAGRLLAGEALELEPVASGGLVGADWPEELAEIIYIDHYGNAMSGLRAAGLASDAILRVGEVRLRRRHTFSDARPGEAFWYANSLGLVEIAVNQGRCDRLLGLSVGSLLSLP